MAAAAAARRRLHRAGVTLAALTFALAGAEAVARLAAPGWLRARMREVSVGRALASWGADEDWPIERDGGLPVRFAPGSTFTVRHDEYVHTARIDELGGRVSGAAEAGGRPIVPVFGDSMTFGVGVRDAETFVSLVAPSLPVRLVNFGMPGSELLDQLGALERLDARLGSPRACIFVVFLGNDLGDIANASAPASSGEAADAASWSDWLFAANRALDERSLLRRSYAVQWARAVAVRTANASRRAPQVERVFALMDRAAPIDDVRLSFGRAVDRLVRTSVRLRFTPIVLVVPDRFQIDARLRRDKAALYGIAASQYDARRPNAIVADALTARGVAFLDATSCLEGREGQYYVRDTHFTAAGHATVAACVAPFLVARVGEGRR